MRPAGWNLVLAELGGGRSWGGLLWPAPPVSLAQSPCRNVQQGTQSGFKQGHIYPYLIINAVSFLSPFPFSTEVFSLQGLYMNIS